MVGLIIAANLISVDDEPSTTVSQDNALESARSYLDYAGFSRDGLVEQLKFEEFSAEDAEWAVKNSRGDWDAEAVEAATSYLDYASFSRQGLIDQLIFDGFTPEQAEFGAESSGL